MADKRLFVQIDVENSATRVFKEIGQAAKAAAQEMTQSSDRARQAIDRLDKAADGAEDAVKGLSAEQKRAADAADELEDAQRRAAAAADDMATQSEAAGRSLSNYGNATRDAISGLALLGTAFTMYAGQAREHEITIMAVQRMYGEAADSYIAFADTIQNTTIFSNDEALAAARIMGTLRENYDLTDQQIQSLISTSADLATMHGFTLSDAAQRVSAAIRGEAESAEMLGLTMNQAAIDTNNLTLKMSNAEAAAFRYDALMEQASSSVGAAGEAADTTAGKTQQLANEFQDAMLSAVSFTGPVGDVASSLGSFGIEAGIAVGGLAQLVKGLSNASKAAGGFTAVMGPAGLVVLGLGAAVAAGTLLARSMRDDVAEAMKTAQVAGEDLNATISNLTANMDGVDLTFLDTVVGSDDALDRLQEHLAYWKEISDTWGSLPTDRLNLPASAIAELDEETRASIETHRQMLAYLAEYEATYGTITDGAIMLAEAERDLATILQHQGAGRQEVMSQLADLTDGYESGAITIAEYIAALDELEQQLYAIDNDVILDALAAQEQATTTSAAAVDVLTDAWLEYEVAVAQAAQAEYLRWQAQQDQARANLWSGAEPVAADVVGLDPVAMRFASMGRSLIDITNLSEAATIAQYDYVAAVLAYVPAADAFNKKHIGYAAAVEQSSRATEDFDRSLGQLTGTIKGEIGVSIAELEADFARLAETINDPLNAPQALSSTFNTVIGGAQTFARLSESVWEWSHGLTEGNKAQSVLGDLFRDGLISGKTYRDGLEANHRIMLANNSVQEDALRIQAKQLPLMAQLAEEHARYVDSIADMPAQQQLVALGFQDQAKAAQALELAQLAASAGMAGMETSAANMITQIAEADPVMKAMLVDMGLISEGADGTITVNFPNGDSLTVSVDNLTASIDALIVTMGGIPSSIHTRIDATDNATGVILDVGLALDLLNGKTATTYVNTVGLSSGSLAATGTTVMSRPMPMAAPIETGIVRRATAMATGGTLTLVGEAGPELVTLPTGSQVTNAAGTRGRLDPMGRGRTTRSGDVFKGNNITMIVTSDDNALTRRADRMTRRRA